MVARLTEEVSRFLDNPSEWHPSVPDEDHRDQALDLIRQTVHGEFHSLAMHRLVHDQLEEWRRAYDFRGRGSTFHRAQELRGIYEDAAPIPTSVVTGVSAEFLDAVRAIVLSAIEQQRLEFAEAA
jgi:hypothetical protein